MYRERLWCTGLSSLALPAAPKVFLVYPSKLSDLFNAFMAKMAIIQALVRGVQQRTRMIRTHSIAGLKPSDKLLVAIANKGR